MFLLFILLFALDRLTKVFALFFLSDITVLNSRSVYLFDNFPLSLVVFIGAVSLLGWWFCHELFSARQNTVTACAAAFIFSGALSNLFDRFRYGAIVDWITISNVSVFNLADTFIIIGSILIIVSFFFEKKI